MTLKFADRNYVLNYFVIGVIPSQTLRISSGLRLRTASELPILSFLRFGAGQRLSIFSVILNGALAE